MMSRGREFQMWGALQVEAALCETGSHPRNFQQVVTGGPELP